MALRIELDGYKPGIAKFLAKKWDGSPDIDMLIQRNQDSYYLLGLKQWSPEKTWHPVTNLMVDNQQLSGEVSEWLVDSLLSQDNSVRFFIQIRDNQNENYIDGGVVNITESVLASSALDNSSSSTDNNQVEIESKSELSVEQTIDTLQQESTTEQEVIPDHTPAKQLAAEPTTTPQINEPIKSKSKLGLMVAIVVILLLLVGIGIATWYFLFSQNQQKDSPSVQISSQCSLNNATGDDLSFIQQCLQTKPDADAIIQLINEAKKTDKCNIAQRLYANQAQQNAKIAMLYAKEYDDKYYQGNNCFKADKETAIYWYETSLTHDANNTLVKERLSELQK